MSGEGIISNVAEVRARIEAFIGRTPAFDQRPGELEATRGLAVAGVIGTHLPHGWEVGLQLGNGISIEMPVADARKLAAEIVQLCDFLEFGVPE